MNIRWIQKQSGHIEAFDPGKVERSIASSLRHADMDPHGAPALTREAIQHLTSHGKETVTADAVRQAVMRVLRERGETAAMQSYELISLHLKDPAILGVSKRGGNVEPFHPLKLFKSIKKSFRDAGLQGGKVAEELTRTVTETITAEYRGTAVPSGEIRKRTAALLKKRGFPAVEKFYILHKYS